MIKAQIVADSKNTHGNRLTTMVVTFPRFILAELNTHRLFSRNSASSRAIPFKKMVESVKTNPFIPIAWQKDHSGMQGAEYITDSDIIQQCEWDWLQARDFAVQQAESLNRSLDVTKQLCNRLLEPFMWHTVLITATEWENFFKLRCPQYVMEYTHNGDKKSEEVYRSKRDLLLNEGINDVGIDWLKMNKGQAEIHMMALAEAMWDAYNESTPKQLQPGEYHIPFGDDIDIQKIDELYQIEHLLHYGYKAKEDEYSQTVIDKIRIKIAVARCARVSYTVVGEEGKPANYENDIKLYDRLLTSGHMSPFEHIGRAMTDDEYNGSKHISYEQEQDVEYTQYGWSGNFRGFLQHRKTLE